MTDRSATWTVPALCLLVLSCASCGRVGFDQGDADAARDSGSAPVDASDGDSAVGDATTDAEADADAGPSPLALEAPRLEVNYNSRMTFSATGGVPPYTFSITSGDGTVNGATGAFFSAGFAGSVVLRVTDSSGTADELTIEVGGDTLYYAGGRSTVDVTFLTHADDVWSSTDAVTWTPAGLLPFNLYNGVMLVFEDALWFIGGREDATTWHSEVWRSTDGTTWSVVGNLPGPRAAHGGAIFRERIWIVGGYNAGTTFSNVWSSADGVTWTDHAPFPTATYGGSLSAFDGRLWYIGGYNDPVAFDDVWWTRDGTTWTELTAVLPAPCFSRAFTRFEGSEYLVGGRGAACETGVARGTGGTAWTSIGPLASAAEGGAAEVFSNEMIFAGGNSDQVLSSTDGMTWSPKGMLPAVRNGGRLVAFSAR